jgi:hypothetical protein
MLPPLNERRGSGFLVVSPPVATAAGVGALVGRPDNLTDETMDDKQHHGGDNLKDLDRDQANATLPVGDGEDSGAGVKDDQEGGSTQATSMSDGPAIPLAPGQRSADSPEAREGGPEADAARPGGRREGAAADEQGPIGMSSAEPGPQGPGGGGQPGGPGSGGSQNSGYSADGRLVGHDSPAGEDARLEVEEGQGDDLAQRLGGGERSGAGLSGSGAVSGDMSAGRSEKTSEGGPATGFTPDAGSPGGMGGKSAGGASPIEDENTRGGSGS